MRRRKGSASKERGRQRKLRIGRNWNVLNYINLRSSSADCDLPYISYLCGNVCEHDVHESVDCFTLRISSYYTTAIE
jgi:hypothetical protein